MPPEARDRRRAKRGEIAQQWARWLKDALAAHQPPMAAADLARKSGGALDTGKITHWTNGDNTAAPDSAILVARLLCRDPVDALRAAGHQEIASLAEDLRRDALTAYMNRQEADIEDDPWLRWLDQELEQGAIPKPEYDRLREDFLARKRESIRLMRADYAAALVRIQPEVNGDDDRAAR